MSTLTARTLALLLLAATALQAQVPQLIDCHGRVAVHGLNFKGTGHFKFALVDAAGSTTYWSNDGTSTAGSEPVAAVALTVTKGLYSVLLGDATLPNMALLPAGVFENPEVSLRVWFNDGTNGSQQLTPDQPIAAPSAAGRVHTGQARNGTAATEVWQQRASGTGPGERFEHTAVWTGSEMIVWGGYSRRSAGTDSSLNDGGRYDPALNSWTPLPTLDAPAARADHTAVWADGGMIVWGGSHFLGDAAFTQFFFSDGGRYNPAANAWTPIPGTLANNPSARHGHTAVWNSAGNEMIVWGGYTSGFGQLNDGGRYNLATNTWTLVPNTLFNGPPSVRESHTAVWADSEMIVWGGDNGSVSLNDGGRYTPGGSWTPVTTAGAPAPRHGHTAIWDTAGKRMIVWGGDNGINYFNDTFSYSFTVGSSGLFPITSVVLSGGNLTLSFRTLRFCTYTLWSSDTLGSGTWTNTGLSTLGNGATSTFTVPALTPPRRFFRVQVGP